MTDNQEPSGPAHYDDEENQRTRIYNVWFKQLRLAHEFTTADILQILQFTEGCAKSKSVINGWSAAEGSAKFVEMRKAEWRRVMAGLPMYMHRKRHIAQQAEIAANEAEALAQMRRAATKKRLETIARKKAETGA